MGYTLTREPERQGNRRSELRSTGFCDAEITSRRLIALGTASGPPLTSRHEFPFASTEDRGSGFLGLNPCPRTCAVRTCVPTWQNPIQGNCHDLLNNLGTNINYFNTYQQPTDASPHWAHWARWNQQSWATKQPHNWLPGLSADDRRNPKMSYYNSNFTLHLTYPRANGNPGAQWLDQAWSSGTISGGSKQRVPVTRTVGSSTWIVCVVSTMGQQRYRYTGSNGYCRGGASMKGTWSSTARIICVFQCKITLAGSGPGREMGSY
ncbi:hypothetical protein BDW71DRAFT_208960 [Aspergillus fruticulosus]